MWTPDLTAAAGPAYLAIVEAIAADVSSGRLRVGERLPSHRALAAALDLNVTTVARGYAEARKRGLLDARVGSGSRVAASPQGSAAPRGIRRDRSDRSMNQAPEPDGAEMETLMGAVWREASGDLRALMRYQSSIGSPEDRAAALRWLALRGVKAADDCVLVTAGTHPAMASIMRIEAAPGDAVCCEDLTYPGVRAVSASLGLELRGLAGDAEGPLPDALAQAAADGRVRLLYMNPTIRNPTTETTSNRRRAELVATARRLGVVIIEDDAYGLLPTDAPSAIATLAPEITYYVVGLSKCFGAGLRVAYVAAPSRAASVRLTEALRALTIMPSPLTVSVATRCVEAGAADAILDHVRRESALRTEMALELLPPETAQADRSGFHLWVTPPPPWTRQRLVDWMRGHALGVVAADPFVVGRAAPNAVRLCLGGAADRTDCRKALLHMREAFERPPEM